MREDGRVPIACAASRLGQTNAASARVFAFIPHQYYGSNRDSERLRTKVLRDHAAPFATASPFDANPTGRDAGRIPDRSTAFAFESATSGHDREGTPVRRLLARDRLHAGIPLLGNRNPHIVISLG